MSSKLYLVIWVQLILISVNFIETSQQSCSTNTKCFDCAMSGSCNWDSTSKTCKQRSNDASGIYEEWVYNMCFNDENSSQLRIKYCGEGTIILNGSSEGYIMIPEVNGQYGYPNLSCKFTYHSSSEKKNIKLTVVMDEAYASDLNITAKAIFEDDTSGSRRVKSTKYVVVVDSSAKETDVFVTMKHTFGTIPFSIKVELVKQGVSITLIATIVLISIACIICAVSIYLFSKRIARQRQLAREAMMHRHGIAFQAGGEMENPQITQEMIKEKRKRQINQLFSTELKPIRYSEDVGKYNVSCSICLEDYTSKSLVCVTKCNHVFHYDCLKKFFDENILEPRCPNCNNHLLPDLAADVPQDQQVIRFVPNNSNTQMTSRNPVQNSSQGQIINQSSVRNTTQGSQQEMRERNRNRNRNRNRERSEQERKQREEMRQNEEARRAQEREEARRTEERKEQERRETSSLNQRTSSRNRDQNSNDNINIRPSEPTEIPEENFTRRRKKKRRNNNNNTNENQN